MALLELTGGYCLIILKDDEGNQPKDKIKRSRKQKGTSKIQREKKQDKKKRREAEQREAFQ